MSDRRAAQLMKFWLWPKRTNDDSDNLGTGTGTGPGLGETLPDGGFSPQYAAERRRISEEYEARRNVELILNEVEHTSCAGDDDSDGWF